MAKNKNSLVVLPIIASIIGMGCAYFLNPICFLILIPMGALSMFYVIPLIPFYDKSPTLRDIPYLKIFIIGFVWSLIIIGLPTLSSSGALYFNIEYFFALLQVFLFTIAITLPFDIRDVDYDKDNNLKTIPRLLGVINTIILAEILLIGSILLLYNSNISSNHFYGLFIGHFITMVVISFSKKERSELFFAGLVEGLILVIYVCVLISEYSFSL
jgi:4-hydroxybenzoate polyprenyltransferase